MNHGLKLFEDGTLEIILPNGKRVHKVIVRDAVMDGWSQTFKPAKKNKPKQDVKEAVKELIEVLRILENISED